MKKIEKYYLERPPSEWNKMCKKNNFLVYFKITLVDNNSINCIYIWNVKLYIY